MGDADAVVLATTFDGDGARDQIPPDVVDSVRGVEGVAAAEGAARRFVQVYPGEGATGTASRRSIGAFGDRAVDRGRVASSCRRVVSRADASEVAVNRVLAEKFGLTVGAHAVVRNGPLESGVVCAPFPRLRSRGKARARPAPLLRPPCSQAPPVVPVGLDVVGIFNAPGGDVDDVSLAALTTDALQTLTNGTGYDRIDVKAADGTDIEGLLDRIGATLPPGLMVVPGSVVGTAQQVRNELEIQRAYHWLLSTDVDKRVQSNQAPPRPENGDRWAENEWQAVNTEMRVVAGDVRRLRHRHRHVRDLLRRRAFVARTGSVHGLVLRVDGMWKLSAQDICQLSAIQGPGCDAPADQDPANFVVPPDGWSLPSTTPRCSPRSACSPTRLPRSTHTSARSKTATRCASRSPPVSPTTRHAPAASRSTSRARVSSTPTTRRSCTRSSRVVSRTSRRRTRSLRARCASTARGTPPVATRAG